MCLAGPRVLVSNFHLGSPITAQCPGARVIPVLLAACKLIPAAGDFYSANNYPGCTPQLPGAAAKTRVSSDVMVQNVSGGHWTACSQRLKSPVSAELATVPLLWPSVKWYCGCWPKPIPFRTSSKIVSEQTIDTSYCVQKSAGQLVARWPAGTDCDIYQAMVNNDGLCLPFLTVLELSKDNIEGAPYGTGDAPELHRQPNDIHVQPRNTSVRPTFTWPLLCRRPHQPPPLTPEPFTFSLPSLG